MTGERSRTDAGLRETSASRFVAATPPVIEAALDPRSVVEYEGSFEVFDVDDDGEVTLVTAGGGGLQMTLRFEPRTDGLYYEQVGNQGPFDAMWTRLRWDREDEGCRVTARSGVSLGLPPSTLTDWVAAWKRRGELRRALAALAETVE